MKPLSEILYGIGIALCICAIGVAWEKISSGGAGDSGRESLAGDGLHRGDSHFDSETSVSHQRAKGAKQRHERKASNAVKLIRDLVENHDYEQRKELANDFLQWSEQDVHFAKQEILRLSYDKWLYGHQCFFCQIFLDDPNFAFKRHHWDFLRCLFESEVNYLRQHPGTGSDVCHEIPMPAVFKKLTQYLAAHDPEALKSMEQIMSEIGSLRWGHLQQKIHLSQPVPDQLEPPLMLRK